MKNHPDTVRTSKDNLNELQALARDVESMATDPLSENSAESLSNLRERFAAAQERFSELYDGAKQKVVAGAKYTDTSIRANPYQSLAIAAGVGLLIGILVGRRTK